MDREYLEDYEQKELSEYERLVVRRIREGKFDFEKDRFPPSERFVNLQEPVALTTLETAHIRDLWTQVPFCGSLILPLMSFPRSWFESCYFKISDIPKIIDFIKETGRLQIALADPPTQYEGLDYFDSFFKELNPPVYYLAPVSIFGNKKEVQKVEELFFTLGEVRFLDFLRKRSSGVTLRAFSGAIREALDTYIFLKLGHYTVVEDIENLMVEDPQGALRLFNICADFIVYPIVGLRSDLKNFTLGAIRDTEVLPLVYQPKEIRFPCEIGKFLLRKLTHAPQGMRACNELIDEYDAYGLQKVLESLNEAIVTYHPDVVNKSIDDLSEILDNVWNDPTIPRRIKNLRRGIPISIAAIGSAVSVLSGGLEGFLAGLGFSVGAKFIDAEIAGLSEGLAKLFTKSYQANVYDFKKKYKGKIAHP